MNSIQNTLQTDEQMKQAYLRSRETIEVNTDLGKFVFYKHQDILEEHLIKRKMKTLLKKVDKKRTPSLLGQKIFAEKYAYLFICNKICPKGINLEQLNSKELDLILLPVIQSQLNNKELKLEKK